MASVYIKHTSSLINSHQYQGSSYDCGPFCLAIILNSMGEKIQGEEIASELNKPRWHFGIPILRRIPNWATFPWGLIDILKLRGVQVHWKIMESKQGLFSALNTDIIPIVIIGSIIPFWSHILILVASDDEKGWGFVDPAIPTREIHWFTDNYFLFHWSIMGRNVLYVNSS